MRKIIVEGVLIATLIWGISAFYSTEIRMFINVIKTKVFFGLSIRGREKNTAEKIDVEKKPHRINDKLRKLIGIAFGIRHKNTAMFFWTAAVLPAFAVFAVLAQFLPFWQDEFQPRLHFVRVDSWLFFRL